MRPYLTRHRHTVTVRLERYRTGATDRRGNPVPAWDAPVDVPHCLIAPTSTIEPAEAGRDAVITTPTLYAPPGTVIGAQDRVTGPDGTLYTVQGTPAVWPANPITASDPPGVVISLKHVEG